MKDTARAAARFGVTQVNGFTGSSIWHLLYSFPPNDFDGIERGYEAFAEAWSPDPRRLRPGGRAVRAGGPPDRDRLRLRDHAQGAASARARPAFGINFDPSHFAHQHLDAAAFAREFADRIYHVHVKDSKKRLDGRRSILGSHLNFGDEARGWDFVSPGPRRRGLRSALPRTQPDRLHGPALHRVGGLGNGSRVRRPGCARVRPSDGLPRVERRLRRGDAARRLAKHGLDVDDRRPVDRLQRADRELETVDPEHRDLVQAERVRAVRRARREDARSSGRDSSSRGCTWRTLRSASCSHITSTSRSPARIPWSASATDGSRTIHASGAPSLPWRGASARSRSGERTTPIGFST